MTSCPTCGRDVAGGRQLPNRRRSVTHKAKILVQGGVNVYITVGFYEDGSAGEIFINTQKEGSALRTVLNAFAIVVSIGLQHGIPLGRFVDALVGTSFLPNGKVESDSGVAETLGLIDLVFRILGVEYLGRVELRTINPLDIIR